MTQSPVAETNSLLQRIAISETPPVICLLTGSSGCGKTYLAKALAATLDQSRGAVFYFDSIGVPSLEEMMRDFGSGEKWQEAKTHEWIKCLAAIRDKGVAVLEGQFHPRFAIEACRASAITEFVLAVVTCEEEIWSKRLFGPRGQPELVTGDMRHWARVLREQTVRAGGAVIDTTESNLQRNLSEAAAMINKALRARISWSEESS